MAGDWRAGCVASVGENGLVQRPRGSRRKATTWKT